MADLHENIPTAGVSLFAEITDRHARLKSAHAGMVSFLMGDGLNLKTAQLAADQVMAGNPARSIDSSSRPRPPAIHVLANAEAQAAKVERALSHLAGALDPYMPTSLSIERDSADIAYRLVPWGGSEKVAEAALRSPFASGGSFHPPSPSFLFPPSADTPLDKSIHPRRMAGHPDLATEAEALLGNLHRLADLGLRSSNLNSHTTFDSKDAHLWAERLLAGGTTLLPIRNRSAQARPFYEQLAQAALSDAQALRGVIASHSIEWQEGKIPVLRVQTGIPAQA